MGVTEEVGVGSAEKMIGAQDQKHHLLLSALEQPAPIPSIRSGILQPEVHDSKTGCKLDNNPCENFTFNLNLTWTLQNSAKKEVKSAEAPHTVLYSRRVGLSWSCKTCIVVHTGSKIITNNHPPNHSWNKVNFTSVLAPFSPKFEAFWEAKCPKWVDVVLKDPIT